MHFLYVFSILIQAQKQLKNAGKNSFSKGRVCLMTDGFGKMSQIGDPAQSKALPLDSLLNSKTNQTLKPHPPARDGYPPREGYEMGVP